MTGLGGQDDETGLYLSQKDAEVLTAEVNPSSYVYTGSPIEPITVKFGTTELVIDEDYRVSYTNNTIVGTATANATFIGNYTGTKKVTFTITKATPTGLTLPTAAALNYGQTLADSALSGGTGAGTWAWADSTIVPTVGNSGYDAIFDTTDTDNYTAVTKTIGITVNPIPPNAPTSVTVTTNDGRKTATCNITVLPAGAIVVTVTRVSVAPKTSRLTVGKAVQLTAKTEPNNATFADISWLSSDIAIATVDDYGKVTAVSAGTATVTITTNDGGKTATCNITVLPAGTIVVTVTRVSASPKTSSLTVGKTVQLTAKPEPNNATFAAISWLSSDTEIATVDGYGKVTAVSAGTATITAKNNRSGLSDTGIITVTSSGGTTPPVIPAPSTSRRLFQLQWRREYSG